jgi:polyhydroxybutyrate depolymerase
MHRAVPIALLLVLTACRRHERSEPTPAPAPPATGCDKRPQRTVKLAGFADRPVTIHLPPAYDCDKELPVVLMLHGGGGRAEHAAESTCPQGYTGLGKKAHPQDAGAPGCLNALADREGFIVAYPSGALSKKNLVKGARAWKIAPAVDGYVCTGRGVCDVKVDEIAYFNALFKELDASFHVDDTRVYSTGISNGALMSYRLACEMPERIAAIAPVAGSDMFELTGKCHPKLPVPILHIHGAQDPVYPFEGGDSRVLGGRYLSVCEGLFGSDLCTPVEITSKRRFPGWLARNGCKPPLKKDIWDPTPGNATRVVRTRPDCPPEGEIELLLDESSGHAWPGGWQYLPARDRLVLPGVGPAGREMSANEVIWAFFKRHRRARP